MATTVRRISSEADVNLKLQTALGTKSPLKADISSTDYVVPVDCRCIVAVGGTKVVVDMLTTDGAITDVSLPSPAIIPIINVTKIKKTGTDATAITLWPMDF